MAKSSARRFDVIIPTWNGRRFLTTCLDSLRQQTFQDFRVIVVDNGSTDDSVDYVRRCHPGVDLVLLPENRGFSAAVNAGIRSGAAPWVLLLNNDVEVDKNCLQRLAEQCLQQPLYDMFALKMVSFDRRTILDGAGDGVLRGGVGYRLGTLEKDGPDYGVRREVFGACAGAALYRRSLFARIGYFEERFFAYLEDVDLNMRAVRSGSRCCYLPDAVVYHIGSATTGSKINDVTVRLSTRNNILVLAGNYPVGLFVRFLPAVMVYQFFWLLFVIKKGRFAAYLKGLAGALPLVVPMTRRRAERRGDGGIGTKAFGDAIVRSEIEVIRSIMKRRAQQGKRSRALQLYLRLLC